MNIPSTTTTLGAHPLGNWLQIKSLYLFSMLLNNVTLLALVQIAIHTIALGSLIALESKVLLANMLLT